MKSTKSLISLAVATLISVPFEAVNLLNKVYASDGNGPTVYGRIRLGVQRNETSEDGNNWGLEDQSSRIGIRGKERINDKLAIPYQYEFGATAVEDGADDDPLSRRLAWVGLEGDLGRISFGRQWSSYYQLVGGEYNLGQEGFDVNHMQSETTSLSNRVSDAIQYRYNIGKLNFGVDIVMDQDDSLGGESFSDANSRGGDFDDFDGYTIGANYETDNWRIATGYQESQAYELNDSGDINKKDGEVWSLWGHYKVGKKSFIFVGIEDGSMDTDMLGNDTVDGQTYHTGFTTRMGNWQLWSILDFFDLKEKANDSNNIFTQSGDRQHYSFGTSYFLSTRTRLYAEFGFIQRDTDSDTDLQVVGIRHDF